LAPEVLQNSFEATPGHPPLTVLDTSDPASILAVERSLDLASTLFIVSSKSGTTLETISLYRYFFDKLRAIKGGSTGDNFVAITDPGTPLESIARENGFRRCFLAAPDVGGRYSALIHFGLVPGAVIGVDVARLLDRAEALLQGCASCVPPEDNPGAWLGAILGELTRDGRDKVTLVTSPPLASFGAWAEQLLAESTGKEGRGLVPVDGEPLAEPTLYGGDRLFVYLRLDSADGDDLDEKVRALEGADQPVVRLRLADAYDLGWEFLRWGMATAVAGAILGINPLDQPNVQESKDNTARLLGQFEEGGRLPEPEPVARDGGLSLFCAEEMAAGGNGFVALLGAHLRSVRPGDYLALMAYLSPTAENQHQLQEIRLRLRDDLKVATTLGYGPRFLHSTGQLHKGGPGTGVFLQLTADDPEELSIPGEKYGFSTLKRAQSLGDLQSLQARKRRVLRIHLGADVAAGLERLRELVAEALG
ncbi:MAG: transaldolase, partial [Dehalococcoidia bacterium]